MLFTMAVCYKFSRETGPIYIYKKPLLFIYIYIYKTIRLYVKTYNEELTHTIMEPEKSHNLPSKSWTPRTVGCIIQRRSQGLRTGGTCVKGTWVQPKKQRKMRCLSLAVKQEKRGEFLFPLPFVMFTDIGESQSSLLSDDSNANLLQNHFHRQPEIVLNLGTQWPNWHVKLSSTVSY